MSAQPTSPAGERPGVLIVGANAGTRAGIRFALEPSVDCYEARTIAEAVAVATGARPTVVLVAAEGHDEMNIVSQLSAALPYAHIVVLAHEPRDDQLLAAVRAGAVGYLSEHLDPDRLPYVVRGVMRGEAAIPRVLVTRLVDELRERRKRRQLLLKSRDAVDLTSREWEVLELLRQGGTTKDIAASLGISEVTVRRHIGTLLHKLEVEDRKAAIALVENWTFV
ncbi:MAG: LuxR C-terminal-related transcriptional regulator [Gaiellaceae bacterium]